MSDKPQATAPLITWTPEMAVGNPVIDAQHQHLLELCNRLESSARGQKAVDSVAFNALLAEIDAYAEYHFRSEERILLETGFTDVETHASEHQHYLNSYRHYMAAAMKPSIHIEQSVAEWTRKWWIGTIQGESQVFRLHFSQSTTPTS